MKIQKGFLANFFEDEKGNISLVENERTENGISVIKDLGYEIKLKKKIYSLLIYTAIVGTVSLFTLLWILLKQ
ncbi:MAG: hypothetical protein LBG15_08090 [Dysgonamonadaceae bacterium]|jgi:hypothetical protein|nr:hypothetical protein [Dysgonamonadaceae bacterium]